MLLEGKIVKDTFGILNSISFYGNILMSLRYLSDWTAISAVLKSSNILPLKPSNFLCEQKADFIMANQFSTLNLSRASKYSDSKLRPGVVAPEYYCISYIFL